MYTATVLKKLLNESRSKAFYYLINPEKIIKSAEKNEACFLKLCIVHHNCFKKCFHVENESFHQNIITLLSVLCECNKIKF